MPTGKTEDVRPRTPPIGNNPLYGRLSKGVDDYVYFWNRDGITFKKGDVVEYEDNATVNFTDGADITQEALEFVIITGKV